MNYLTNYYKNLSEQLQERLNYLTKVLNEAKKSNETPTWNAASPEYDYEAHSDPRAWEISDIHPESKEKIAQRYSSRIGPNDIGFEYEEPKHRAGTEAMGRKAYKDEEGQAAPSEPVEYSTKADRPSAAEIASGLSAMRNKAIALANQRRLAAAEVKTLGGNMDLLIPAVSKAEKEITGEEPTVSSTDLIFDRMREEEIARRKAAGKRVRE